MAENTTQIKLEPQSEVHRILDYLKGYFQDHMWSSWTEAYKGYFMNKLDRGLQIKDFQENVKMPITKMYIDAMWTGIYDNVINFRVMGRDKSDNENAENVREFLEWGFAASNSRKELMSSVKEALVTGNGFAKIGFVNNTSVIKYKKLFKTHEHKYKEQYPYVKYVSAYDIFFDPTVEYFEDSPYVIHRSIMSSDEVTKCYSSMIVGLDSKLQDAKESPLYFSNYDYNKIKHSLFWNMDNVKSIINDEYNNNFDLWTQNYLTINYEEGMFYEIIEYRKKDKLIILINGHEVYNDVNPLPINTIPFVGMCYNKIPGLPFGHGIGTSLKDIQGISDTILNLTMDNIKFQIAPMYQKLKGSDMFGATNGEGELEYSPFKVLEVNTPDGFQRLNLGTPDFSGIQLIQFLLQLGEMSEGVNSYSLGYQNKVERSATGVSALVQAFKARLLPLVESMNMALAKISEMWLATAIVLMDEKITIRVIGNAGAVKFKEISIESLLGKFDIEFDAQALKSATREVRRSQIIQVLQLAGQYGIDQNMQQSIIDMPKLWSELLDTFELPQDLVLSSSEIYKKQQKMQKLMNVNQGEKIESTGGSNFEQIAEQTATKQELPNDEEAMLGAIGNNVPLDSALLRDVLS